MTTMWLSATSKSPVPSGGLIAETAATPTKISLWNIWVYRLSYPDAVTILHMTNGRRTLADGIIPGEDMVWWAGVLRQAGSMVARRQYLPDAVPNGGTYAGAWSPVFAGEVAGWINASVARMPAVGWDISVLEGRGGLYRCT